MGRGAGVADVGGEEGSAAEDDGFEGEDGEGENEVDVAGEKGVMGRCERRRVKPRL